MLGKLHVACPSMLDMGHLDLNYKEYEQELTTVAYVRAKVSMERAWIGVKREGQA